MVAFGGTIGERIHWDSYNSIIMVYVELGGMVGLQVWLACCRIFTSLHDDGEYFPNLERHAPTELSWMALSK